jgi:hypothetical protein
MPPMAGPMLIPRLLASRFSANAGLRCTAVVAAEIMERLGGRTDSFSTPRRTS